MERADEKKVTIKIVPEDMKFLEKVVEELIKSELYLLETNILSGEQIIQILVSKGKFLLTFTSSNTDVHTATGFVEDGSVENAVQIGQRLIDAHKLQSMQDFEEFENSSEFYRFRVSSLQLIVSSARVGTYSAFVLVRQ